MCSTLIYIEDSDSYSPILIYVYVNNIRSIVCCIHIYYSSRLLLPRLIIELIVNNNTVVVNKSLKNAVTVNKDNFI